MVYQVGNTPGSKLGADRNRGLWVLARQELSAREQKVWTLMAAGCSDAEIAEQLGVNGLTVRFHVRNLLAKLDASDRQEATSLARQRGLVA